MNDREFGNKIKQDLNYGLGRLDARVTERLKQARERALDAYAAQEVTSPSYALAGHHGHTQHHIIAPRKWLPLAMVILALVGVMYWQQEMNQDEAIDAALLASDIPLDVYTDHGFHSWLDSSIQR